MTQQPNYIIDSRQINLSSDSSLINNNNFNSQLLFKVNGLLKPEEDILYNLISVQHAEIPVSYYVINYSNNIIILNGISYTLTRGNYNAISFKTMLLSIIPSTYSLSLNLATAKYTLSNSTIDFTVDSGSTCYWIMGFLQDTTYTSNDKSFVFPFPCNFLGLNRITIKSNILRTKNIDSSVGVGNTLITIPVSATQNGLIIYNNYSQFKCVLLNDTIDYIDISIEDEDQNLINFNNVSLYITLQIDSIRKSPITDNNLTDLMKQNNNGDIILE
jgi:hypothetical protein